MDEENRAGSGRTLFIWKAALEMVLTVVIHKTRSQYDSRQASVDEAGFHELLIRHELE